MSVQVENQTWCCGKRHHNEKLTLFSFPQLESSENLQPGTTGQFYCNNISMCCSESKLWIHFALTFPLKY